MVSSVRQSSIMIAFSSLPDPRKPRNQLYTVFDIVGTAILATLCRCDDYEEISGWTVLHLEWLNSVGLCLNGAPSHDTYERFFRHLDPKAFQANFMKWTQLVAKTVKGVIAIDGKTLRGSRDGGGDPVHMVSAFSAENSLVLGQLTTSGKGKELEGFGLLLELLDLRDTTVTIDAGGCHKKIAHQIKEKGGDYILHLKGNQGHLHGEAQNFFSQAMPLPPSDSHCDYWVSEEKTRGKLFKREVWACDDLHWLPQQNEWTSLISVVCVKTTRSKATEEKVEYRYYISSHKANAEHLGHAIRSHWSIENRLHWHLDVSYREDASRVRKGHGAENLSVLRRATLNLLKSNHDEKTSVKRKRLKASWDRDYLLGLLNV